MTKKTILHPQEIETFYIIPALRKQLALQLKSNGLKQKDIAELLGINSATISQYHSQKRGSQIKFPLCIIKEIKLSAKKIKSISKSKKEPAWMLEKRLQAFQLFQQTPLSNWGPDLKKLNFDKLIYFIDPKTKETNQWDKVPKDIKRTFDKLGIPEAEKNVLSGVGAQFDSNMVYHNLQKSLQEKGVIFENMDIALKKYPELVKKYFMTSCIPINDHKFIMLHAAVWSGGTFI